MQALLHLHYVPTIFARGGGGGSGGDDGGLGIVLVGYVPMHFLGAWLRKFIKKHELASMALQVVGWVVMLVYAVLLIVLFRGWGFLMAIGAPLGMGAGLYGWFGKLTQSKKTKAALAAAVKNDGAWDEARLTAMTTEVFNRFQQDWSNLNAEAMKAYMTPQYQYHNALMVYALQLAGRRNLVNNPKIGQVTVVDIHDAADNSQDVALIGVQASASDQLVDTATNSVIFTDSKPFTEFWRFQRSGEGWLLSGIQQATTSSWRTSPALEQFATQQGYYYSPDWGWLLIPSRGQLFGDAKFGTSDINNHVIGLYKQQLLVQLYTYLPKPQSSGKNYLIAQANLPKHYGNIVVRRKGGLLQFGGIRGLHEVSTEWPDFNKKYQVFATSSEQATSLELLHPSYMQQLEALAFEVSIEVVDNVVYLYTEVKSIGDASQYQTMLALLHAAFNEMRL